MKHVAAIEGLRVLNVPGARLGDEGLRLLKGLKHLKELNVMYSEITGEAVEALKDALPGLRVTARPFLR